MNQWTLRFKGEQIEKTFNYWYLESEIRVLRYSMILGVLTYLAVIPLDFLMHDVSLHNSFLALRISCIFILLALYTLSYKGIKTPSQYQFFAISLAFICFWGNSAFTFFGDVNDYYFYTGNSILIIFVFILLNIRFCYIIFIALFYVFTHLLLLYTQFDFSLINFGHQIYGIGSVATISLISNRIIETQKRQGFLNKKLIEEQKEALQASVNEKDMLLSKLKERNEELDAFNYSVSHDLKTPLRNVNVFSKLLAKRAKNQLDDRSLEYLGFVINGTNKMNVLIDDLLEYSKIRHTDLKYEVLNMNTMVELLFLEQSQPLENKPNLIKNILPAVKGDKILMKQVWANLISNAIKYSSKKENSEIIIGATEGNNEVTYYIKDNGVGFDMKFAAHLFELFRRLHSDRDYVGTGVGLSLVDRIIKKHGGKIWAESIPEQGSTFYFTMPII